MKNWLILADDLTGAADCAIAYCRRGTEATVGWGTTFPSKENRTQIFSFNTDGRELPSKDSAALQEKCLENLWSEGVFLFCKIDSTLRGQPAAIIAQTAQFLKKKTGRGIGVLAPAFPATGRITKGGKIIVNGVPLESTELWQRDHTYPTSDMKQIIEDAGLTAFVIGLDKLRSSEEALSQYIAELENSADYPVFIFDAETEEDLQRIASVFSRADASHFFIGSAGLAHAFAARCALAPRDAQTAVRMDGGVMIVVGSLANASRCAAKELLSTRDIKHFPISPELLLSGGAELDEIANNISQTLQNSGDILVEITMGENIDMSMGSQLAKNLSNVLKNVAPHLAGFAATGGETASFLMDSFGINGIELSDEIEAGVSLGLTRGETKVPVATKAGAFGDENSLVRIFDRLTLIRKEGKL